MNARQKYRQFHGHAPRYRKTFSFQLPKNNELVILGKVVAIEYETDKYNGGGDGTRAVYRHEFETPALVCCDSTGKRQLYILGEKLKVTQKGIER